MLRFLALLMFSLATAFAQYRTHAIPSDAFFGSAQLHLFVFRSSECTVRLMDNGSMSKPRYPNLESSMWAASAIAGCNAGFFTKEGDPLGTIFEQGKQTNAIASGSSLVSGVFFANEDGLHLMRSLHLSKHYKKFSKIQEAVQGGPFLIENYHPTKGLSSQKIAARTFIITDGKGTWAIASCTGISLAKLAQVLANPGNIGGFKVEAALNLDGGTSSAFWVKDRWPRYLMQNVKPVRNYLAVVPKAKKS